MTQRIQRRLFLQAAMAAGVVSALPIATAARGNYPENPLRIVVQFPPGTTPDTIARLAAEHLQAKLGQTVIVENRPGAAGNIAADHVAKSPPDGYTLLLGQNGLAWAPWLFPTLSFDPLALAPITLIAGVPFVLTVREDLPANSVESLIALAKERPGALMCGTSGVGSPQHLAGEVFMNRTGSQLTMVPYKGSSAIFQDFVAKRIDILFSAVEGALPHIQAGRIRPLATLDPHRLEALSETPTMREAGVDLEARFWIGLLAPPDTPLPIREFLAHHMSSLPSNARAAALITTPGNEFRLGSPAEMEAEMQLDYRKWGEVIQKAGIRLE